MLDCLNTVLIKQIHSLTAAQKQVSETTYVNEYESDNENLQLYNELS